MVMHIDRIFANLWSILKILGKGIVPNKYHLRLRYWKDLFRGNLEQEMFYVNRLLVEKRRFVDVGANIGLYTYYFSSKFKELEVFEPISEVTSEIKNLEKRHIKIHNVALSSSKDSLTLNIPIEHNGLAYGLASLELREGFCETRTVDVHTLDSYEFEHVDLIKIDVEGHELAVIEGSVKTLARCRPVLLVEIEQRHIGIKIDHVFKEIINKGYQGYFIYENKLVSIDEFSYNKHQESSLHNVFSPNYVNNFIFLPKEKHFELPVV